MVPEIKRTRCAYLTGQGRVSKMNCVNRLASPQLRDPVLVAGWPGMGLVAFRAVSFMLEKLETRPLAEFESREIYPLKNVEINEGLIETSRLPESRAYYHVADGEGRDLVLFLGEEQPVAGGEWNLSSEILELGAALGVRDVYTFAAMVTHIDHRAKPRVWGCATNPDLVQVLERSDVSIMQDGQISGLNGLLLGVARSRGMNGTCLLGELPYYLTQIAYPTASLVVLERFCDIVGLSLDLDELRALSAATQAEIDTYFEQIKDGTAAVPPGAETLEGLDSLDDEQGEDDEDEEKLLN